MKRKIKHLQGIVTARELIALIPDLKVTNRQREFIKAAFRALVSAAISKRLGSPSAVKKTGKSYGQQEAQTSGSG